MKVRITKCENDALWYRKMVGKEFKVSEETGEYAWGAAYKVLEGPQRGWGIGVGDCEIIEEAKEIPVKQFHNVQNPQHYHHSGLDPISYAEVNFPKEQLKGFHRINVLKYISRYEGKGGVNDLVKARTYLDKLIDLEREDEC
ncbi:DUF3310 domain-containing protein [Pseudobacillus badius]|uniref:DUF3310 domain-containing protein n=1 Tax=Bacillus badius TaxID=1455 RepID=UPI0024A18F5B|nr:DUF3310 domain-containing protein [Bacillus badius]GLY11376.1 hypothetical protein Bbad01_25920 [Bacillus badius]